MKSISILLLLCFLSDIYADIEPLRNCSEKSLFKNMDTFELLAKNGDVVKAYNGIASCGSLKTDDDDDEDDDLKMCCYIKLKIKNKELDQKFEQKGCIEMTLSNYVDEDFDFGKYKDDIKNAIEVNNTVDVKKISIDCSAKYLQLVSISLILFLL